MTLLNDDTYPSSLELAKLEIMKAKLEIATSLLNDEDGPWFSISYLAEKLGVSIDEMRRLLNREF